jgi:hypothetical protein
MPRHRGQAAIVALNAFASRESRLGFSGQVARPRAIAGTDCVAVAARVLRGAVVFRHVRRLRWLRCCVVNCFGAAFGCGHHLRPNHAFERMRRYMASCLSASVAAHRST